MKDLIGWISSGMLLVTFGSQTYMQWKNKDGKYVLLFFIAAILGTAGNLVYSWLVHNWVFTILNGALVVNNSVGLGIALGKHKKGGEAQGG